VFEFVHITHQLATESRCSMVLESPVILEDYFPGLESHGKQQRSCKVLKNDDNVTDIGQKGIHTYKFILRQNCRNESKAL